MVLNLELDQFFSSLPFFLEFYCGFLWRKGELIIEFYYCGSLFRNGELILTMFQLLCSTNMITQLKMRNRKFCQLLISYYYILLITANQIERTFFIITTAKAHVPDESTYSCPCEQSSKYKGNQDQDRHVTWLDSTALIWFSARYRNMDIICDLE